MITFLSEILQENSKEEPLQPPLAENKMKDKKRGLFWSSIFLLIFVLCCVAMFWLDIILYQHDEAPLPETEENKQHLADGSQSLLREPPCILPKAEQKWQLTSKVIYSNRLAKNMVAITFDDGPYATWTEKYLAVLAKCDVKATFFLLGQYVEKNPDVARSIVEAGHEVGSHSWYHHPLCQKDADFVARDFEKCIAIFKKELDITLVLFRPAYGEYNKDLLQTIYSYGQQTILWSVDQKDWQATDAKQLSKAIINTVKSGDIVLLHEARQTTLDALPMIIEELQKKGFTLVTVGELLNVVE